MDGITVKILKPHALNPLDPNSGKEQRVHEFEVGQVVTLNASKARLFIKYGWAVAV
jgi:hypothetical protein